MLLDVGSNPTASTNVKRTVELYFVRNELALVYRFVDDY